MKLLLRAWLRYWQIRYGVTGTSVTGGTRAQRRITLRWTERYPRTDGQGTVAVRCDTNGRAYALLRVMPITTRMLACRHRVSRRQST